MLLILPFLFDIFHVFSSVAALLIGVLARGHVTGLMGLRRPNVNGPIFVYRVPCLIGVQAPRRVQIMVTTATGPEPILAEIAGHFADLADPEHFEPWRLITVDTTRGRSRNRELSRPCYILVDFGAFRSFGLRPHGLIEMILGQEEFSFPTVLPMMLQCGYAWSILDPFATYRTSELAVASLAQWGATCVKVRF